jgi:general stress protein 26
MEKAELVPIAEDLAERAEMLVLGTSGPGGYPYQRALFNLRNKKSFPSLAGWFAGRDPFTVYLGTNGSSLKMIQLGADPRVSVYYMLPAEFNGMMICGEASPDPEARSRIWVEGWERYYPGGRDDPDYVVLRVRGRLVRGWRGGAAYELIP